MGENFKKFLSVFVLFVFSFTNLSFDVLFLQSIKFLSPQDAYADTITPTCAPTSDGSKVGSYSSEIGYCVLEPDSSLNKCLSPYVYSSSFQKCVSQPMCLGMYIWNATTKQCESVTATPSTDTEPVFPENSCAKDLNSDGEIQQNEIQQCLSAQNVGGQQAYLCPIDAVNCNVNTLQPTCPSGTVLNQSTGKCEADPQIECPSGTTYASDLKKCLSDPTCPNNGVLDINNDICKIALTSENCPTGYTYSTEHQGCIKDIDCGSGFVYNPTIDKCEVEPQYQCPTGTTYNSTTGKCETTPSCPEGFTYNATTDRCEKSAQATCPEGYIYNPSQNRCEATVNCPEGTTYNSTTDKCEVNSTVSCPSGTTYNSTTGKCEATPSCPSGTTYNATTDKCEAVATISCPSGTTYNSSTGKCEATPTCPSGFTYSSTADKCVKSATFGCPTGYTYNSSTGKCEANPQYQCPVNGQTYSDSSTCNSACLQTANCNSIPGVVSMTKTEGSGECNAPYYSSSDHSLVFSFRDTSSDYTSTFTSAVRNSKVWRIVFSDPSLNKQATLCWYNFGINTRHKLTIRFNDQYLSNCGSSSSGCMQITLQECNVIQAHKFSTPYPTSAFSPYCSGNASGTSNFVSCNPYIKIFLPSDVSGTSGGYVCPLPGGSSCTGTPPTCTASQSCTTVCPSGGSYNSLTGKCEATPTPSCPDGGTYDSALGMCVQNATCPVGSSLNPTTDKCETNPTAQCPTGTVYNSSTGKCEANAICPTGSSLNTTMDKCEATPQYSCPSGTTYNSSTGKCEASPTCPTGGNYNPTGDICILSIIYGCDTGTLSGDICYITMQCPTGSTFNSVTDKCEADPQNQCPEGTTYNTATNKCEKNPDCPNGGAVNTSLDKCFITASSVCPSGYTYNSSTSVCEASPVCSIGLYSPTIDKCSIDPNFNCPIGSSYATESGKCEAVIVCSSGSYDPNSNQCVDYGTMSCPLGDYPCYFVQSANTYKCSPYQCITSAQVEDEGDVIPFGYEDDGPRDEQGNCLGTIYIFNGKGMRCRKSGVQTGFHNCCNESQGKLYDSTGSTGGGIGAIGDIAKIISGVYQALNIGNIAANLATNGASSIAITVQNGVVTRVVIPGYGTVTGSSAQSLVNGLANNGNLEYLGTSGSDIFARVNPGAVDTATAGTMSDFLKNSGLASSVTSLALSFMIKDPVLSSAVNVAAQSVLWAVGLASPLAVATAVVGLAMALFQKRCDQQDIMTSTFRESGYCHEVGEYCVKKIKFVGCIQKAKGHCCFNSKLARIVHEQGRPQLAGFGSSGGWGDPKNPNCRGFLPEEFQSLDFNKIDLSEYIEDIQRNVRQNLAPQLQEQIQQNWGR